MPVFARIAAASILLALAATPSIGAPKLETAYVVLGPDGTIARAVYSGAADCPSLAVDGAARKMSLRMAPQTGDTAAFPVLVCELAIAATAKSATLEGQSLPLPASDKLVNIAVIGDTGCRLKAKKGTNRDEADYEEEGKFQNCKSDWPFAQLAASVAANKPQLVVHVGDYI